MTTNLMNLSKSFCWLKAFLLTLLISTTIAAAVQQPNDLVTLTVSSSCASVNVRLSSGEVLKTPFTKLLPRGQVVSIEAIEATASSCGALQVVTDFRRLMVNNAFLPKGQTSAEMTLDRDTSVFIIYGGSERPTVTLSGNTFCGRTAVHLLENHVGGQEGRLITHFDLTLFQGQSVKLEALPQISCFEAATILIFHHWVVGGKIFPEGQISIDVPVEKFTTAVPHYSTFVIPYTPLTSFQILRSGNEVDFIRHDDKLKKYTVVLQASQFPQGTKVFVDGIETEIVNQTATQLEVTLPGKRAKQLKIISVLAIAPGNQFFTPAPIEVHQE